MIRKVLVNEVPDIKRLVDPFVNEGLILPKSLLSLYTSVRDFWIMIDDNDPDQILGCCALQVSWVDIAEIRTLAVRKESHGNGIGRSLVQACMDEAVELGLKQLFTLTFVPEFFKKLGFSEVDKSTLPNKIWADCIHCRFFPDCREIALTYQL
ncbi:MAG TPA: N-acetyltransferase [Deltaproteobacteria bacterium]|nr:N-acetyltransferase [Deltaproteobacteria bacterium]